MSRLQPDYYIPHITGVTLEFLRRHGIRGLILDVDNTLTTHDDPTPHPDIAAWLDGMRQAGVGMMIVSNNTEERVRPFAEILGLPYVADGKKPGTDGMRRAAEKLGDLRPEETAVIGDQIFTDILGANLCGMRSVLLDPLSPDPSATVRFKRSLEGFLRPHYTRLTAGEETVKSKA